MLRWFLCVSSLIIFCLNAFFVFFHRFRFKISWIQQTCSVGYYDELHEVVYRIQQVQLRTTDSHRKNSDRKQIISFVFLLQNKSASSLLLECDEELLRLCSAAGASFSGSKCIHVTPFSHEHHSRMDILVLDGWQIALLPQVHHAADVPWNRKLVACWTNPGGKHEWISAHTEKKTRIIILINTLDRLEPTWDYFCA